MLYQLSYFRNREQLIAELRVQIYGKNPVLQIFREKKSKKSILHYLCSSNTISTIEIMHTKTKGYLLGALASATYGMSPLFALPLYHNGMGPDSVLFFRYLFAILIVGTMLIARGHGLRIERSQLLPLALLGLLMALSSLSLFESFNHMAAGIACTILFVYPIIVAVLMALFFRERITWQTALCILMALIGIGLLYKTADGAPLSLAGSLLAIGSALSYAIYIVGVNRPTFKAIPTLKLTFYVLLFGLLLFLFRLDFGMAIQTPEHGYLWLNLVALALFPTAISFFCTTAAIQYIGSTPTAILGALEPLTALFFGLLFFNERLTPREVLGVCIIILAVTLVIAGNQVPTLLLRLRKMFPRIGQSGEKS